MASDRTTRQQAKRAETLEQIARQVRRGELRIAKATRAELEALERASARRRVVAVPMVAEPGELP
jgi:hypothetical protein